MFDDPLFGSAEFVSVVLLILLGLRQSLGRIRDGLGIPMGVVILTVAVWYVGDAVYNESIYLQQMVFPQDTIMEAWRQVAVFLGSFIVAAPLAHRVMNRRIAPLGSSISRYLRRGIDGVETQSGLDNLFRGALFVWAAVLMVAVFRYEGAILYFFLPTLGPHPGSWSRSGIGGGAETFFALANYFHLLVAAVFGVVAALSKNRLIRIGALIGVAVTWPFYIFDRTRKFILAIALPGLLSWVFLRLRGGLTRKVVVLGIAFLGVNAWFGFIISNRHDFRISEAFLGNRFDMAMASSTRHEGFNMFEELAWIIKLTEGGAYSPAWGSSYFANLVNPIPRSLWPDKPTIALDYAVARGLGGGDSAAGVYATLSTGLVGQGVVNFGLYLGPMAAAILMSLWTALLARVDIRATGGGYIPLYALGLVLTFNMGRDITFLESYPFFFGYAVLWVINRKQSMAPISSANDNG